MTSLPNNILHLPEYHLLDSKEEEHDFHFQLEAPTPVACEECGVEGEFVRFGKKQSTYCDLPMYGERVTLWMIRRRYICRACDKTFRPRLPEIVDGYRMTRRLHTHVEKALAQWINDIPRRQKEVWKDLVKAVSNWREEILTYFETEIPITNALTASIYQPSGKNKVLVDQKRTSTT